MQKRLANIERRMPSLLGDDDKQDMPKIREILRMIGNVKADTADNARRTTRIVNQLRDKTAVDLVLESDDMAYLFKRFEENAIGLTAWMQGTILEVIDSAERVEPEKKV